MTTTYLGKVMVTTTKTTHVVIVEGDVSALKRKCIHPRSRLTLAARDIMDHLSDGEKVQSVRIDPSEYFLY